MTYTRIQMPYQSVEFIEKAIRNHTIVPSVIYKDIQLVKIAGPLSGFIIFRNYYCSSVCVQAKLHDSGDKWVTLASKQLMKNPHYEDDAQNWHLIHVDTQQQLLKIESTFSTPFTLRFNCVQISPNWERFELQSINVFQHVDKLAENSNSTKPQSQSDLTLSHKQEDEVVQLSESIAKITSFNTLFESYQDEMPNLHYPQIVDIYT